MATNEQLKQDARRTALTRIEMAQHAQQYAQQQQQMKEAQQVKQVAQGYQPPSPLSAMGPGGPTPANAERVAEAPAAASDPVAKYNALADYYDTQSRQPGAPTMALQKMANDLREHALKFRDENTGMEPMKMPDGRVVMVQKRKYGAALPTDMMRPPEMKLVNQGDRFTSYDANALQPGQSFGVSMDPAQLDASKRGWAAHGLAAEAAKRAEAAQGKPTFHDGQWVYPPDQTNPGGRAVTPTGSAAEDKKRMLQEQSAAAASNVLSTVQEAKGLTSIYTTGVVGAGMANVPGSNAYALRAKVDTIKANLGFDRLQEMRQSSPTGGSLGQVAVQELARLESTVASLDPNMSESQFRGALDKIEQHYRGWEKTVQKAEKTQSDGALTPAEQSELDKLRRKYGR
jgi:hypothetical protein